MDVLDDMVVRMLRMLLVRIPVMARRGHAIAPMVLPVHGGVRIGLPAQSTRDARRTTASMSAHGRLAEVIRGTGTDERT